MLTTKPTSIDEYIASFPEETQLLLEQVRGTIKQAAPDAKETIKYSMPTFTLDGTLVYFAGYKNHIGFYPMLSAIEAFKDELSVYKSAKGSVLFPINKPMPVDLIAKMVALRVERNLSRAEAKKK